MAFNETVFVTGFPGFIAGRLVRRLAAEGARFILLVHPLFLATAAEELAQIAGEIRVGPDNFRVVEGDIDRKSTRLNSSHQIISYAVFCLKKKNSTTRAVYACRGCGLAPHHPESPALRSNL